MTTRGRQIVLAARPKGKPELTDFRLEETAVPTPVSGQLLLEVQYLSLDPYMRGRMNDGKSYATPLQIGDVMTGETVAEVLVSNHSQYVKGDVVTAQTRSLVMSGKIPQATAKADATSAGQCIAQG